MRIMGRVKGEGGEGEGEGGGDGGRMIGGRFRWWMLLEVAANCIIPVKT